MPGVLSGVTTVCLRSKTFSAYCSQGSPLKLSSACEACLVLPADLQSEHAISAHWWYTIKRETTVCNESAVSNDPRQTNAKKIKTKKNPSTYSNTFTKPKSSCSFYTGQRRWCTSSHSTYVKAEPSIMLCRWVLFFPPEVASFLLQGI